MARIPEHFIDDLISRADIIEIINTRINLKKNGREFTALCPFHDEKSPSFTVSPVKQFYHCFGCGAHGTAIGFLMAYDNLDFVSAIEELAQIVGMDVPKHGYSGEHKPPDLGYKILADATSLYQQQLKNKPQANAAVSYLKQRGVTGTIASKYKIGYAPPGWQFISDALHKDHSGDQLLAAGLTIKNENGKVYDRFRDRIMFPIHDYRGRVVAFGGRVLNDDKPKYLNSPETSIFHKGKELYGLYEAKSGAKTLDQLLVVEGYMDVIALAQHDIPYAVATLGTALTVDHLKRLFKVINKITICFDGDKAGREAAWKALNVALPYMQEGREINFFLLPQNEDPDTLVRKGKTQFESLLNEALSFSDFFIHKLKQNIDMSTLDGRAKFAANARPLIDQLPSGIYKQMLNQQIAKLAQIDLPQYKSNYQSPSKYKQWHKNKPDTFLQHISPVRLAISILLQHTQAAKSIIINDAWLKSDIPGTKLLYLLATALHDKSDLSSAALIERWRGQPEYQYLVKLINHHIDIPESIQEDEFIKTCELINKQITEQRSDYLIKKSKVETLSKNEKTELALLLSKK